MIPGPPENARAESTRDDSKSSPTETFADDQRDDVRRARADGAAHGELARPARRRIRHDTVGADSGQDECEHRERPEREPRVRALIVDDVL